MHDELVHVARLLAEPRLSVAALLRRPELVLEERVVLRPDDHEVIRHSCSFIYALVSWVGTVRSLVGMLLLLLLLLLLPLMWVCLDVGRHESMQGPTICLSFAIQERPLQRRQIV